MAIAANDSLIVNKEGAPIDARTVAPTLEALAEIENPYVGLRVFVSETGKEYRVTEIEEVAVGAFAKKQIKTYETLPDAAALEDTFAVIDNLTENHSIEIGFDNTPLETTSEVTDDDGNTVYQTDENGEQILDEEGNPIPETETERAFQCFVVGSNNKYGSSVTIHGDNNENSLGFVRIYGNYNKTYQFQNIWGDNNELTASVNVTVFGNSNKDNGINANGAFIIGNLNEVTGANSYTVGYRLKNHAKGARVFGRYYTLEDTPENEYAFALGDGELDGTTPTGEISLIHRVFKAVENPLFNPDDLADDSDASDPNPKDSSGERKYVAERAYATEYRGHWLAVTRNVDTAGTVTLDHDQYARWNLTASGTVTLALSNWKDGDSGELIVDTTKQTINIPAEWVTLGADITKTPGVYVLEIAQVGTTIFYAIKYPNSGGTITSIGDHIKIIGGYWYIDGVNTGVKAQGTDGKDGTNGATGAQGVGISSIAKTGTSGLVDTYKITLTNGSSTTFTVTNGAKGATGATGPQGANALSFKIGTVTTLAAGASATVSCSIDSSGVVTLNLGIPRGATGATGAKGATGATGAAGADGITAWTGTLAQYNALSSKSQNILYLITE